MQNHQESVGVVFPFISQFMLPVEFGLSDKKTCTITYVTTASDDAKDPGDYMED